MLAAIIGALLAGGAQIALEFYKRADDRRGIASAIAGEIAGIMFGEKHQNLAGHYANLAKALRAGNGPPPPWMLYDKDYPVTPVLTAYIGRVGALGGRIPERVAHFYTLHASIIMAEKILASGFYDREPIRAASHIETALGIWAAAKAEGEALIRDLHAICGEQPDT